ncbi:MAG: NADH-quinone oxidoreductase subunit N, partial [Pseudomonadota bacterium]
AVASVIGAFYYLRIVFFMYFGDPEARGLDVTAAPVQNVFLIAAAAAMVLGIINLFGVEGLAASAATALVN